MWRLHAEGKLESPQDIMFRWPRPVEELYDTQNDHYEINNLAADPAHRSTLQRLRNVLDDWRDEFGDMGDIPEEQMVAQWYPGGVQPQTAPVVFIPISESDPGTDAAPDGGTFKSPLLIQFHCATQGASIAYTTESGENPHWRLYTEPLRLPEGTTTLRAKAIRIGYKESEEKTVTFTVEG
jgi:N-sulfoglucosamine sulfohydrolase